ncbi:unnamed protein product [Ilex paraguariensis]|uniref:Protein kinase domain-containing protein n=1 Tax=Ilex paraguariensis TaxID=185542 RepID=A0ABC8TXA1_9AQUA
MDQFRQTGEVLGSLKALMVLKHDIPINQRQCCLLLDIFTLAFEVIEEEIRQNLRLDERNTKWKALELPMRELHRIFKEGEVYIRYCLDVQDWWGKAISLHQNKSCVEFHIHNLLSCFPVVIEAIETAAEISGLNLDDMQKRRLALVRKYDSEWNDPTLFQWMFGKKYLVPQEICNRLDSVWKEDRWLLLETIRERKSAASTTPSKQEQKLGDLLLKKLNGSETLDAKLLPSSILVGANDYHVRRRLGSGGSHCKEIHWLGESFGLRTFFGEIEPLYAEISLVLSLSHPNIMQYHCGFYDEERKEGYLVMELMNKNLSTCIKENAGKMKRVPFSVPVAVDIMLQIARGMEYIHSRKIYHGDLNPSNVLLKARNSSIEGYFHARVTGFGLTSIKSYTSRSPKQNETNPVIWYAPEILSEQERPGRKCTSKYTEKADVYSFGMLCFELLTGKVPFEDGHLQGDKMVRNIRAGERPLFPYPSPKYLANLTRKCWHTDPINRPSFSSICRILRYIKKILVINPDHGQPESPPPLVDYCDIEAGYSKKFHGEGRVDLAPVSQIPFQIFAFRLIEREKSSGSSKDKSWELAKETALTGKPSSFCGDEHVALMDDLFLTGSDQRTVYSEILDRKNLSTVVDQRSVISEIPHRKLFSADQRSVGSESPGRKSLSLTTDKRSIHAESPRGNMSWRVAIDQRSPCSESPQRKISTAANQKLAYAEIPENTMLSTTADDRSGGSETLQRKIATITAAEQRPVCSESLNKSSSPTEDQRPFCPDTPERKNLSTTTADQRPVCPETPETKSPSAISRNQRPSRPKIQGKKILLTRSLKETKTSKGLGTPKGHSPRSVTTLARKEHYSPSSSPTQTLTVITRAQKEHYSPSSSPTRTLTVTTRARKEHYSPSSSPTQTPKVCSSPRCSPTLEGYSSPLNPCARCSRMSRESPLPTVMSPSRHRKGHFSDSEVA